MLLDNGNPYENGRPQSIILSPEDFSFNISDRNLNAIDRRAKWTVFIYMAANCDLAAHLFEDILEMKAIGSDENVNICVFFVGPLITDSFFARLNKGTPLGEDIIFRFLTLSASEPKILKEVISNNLILYPAENNLVILAGHGLGWKGALEDYAIGKMYIEQGRFSLPPGDDGSHLKYCYDRAIKAINEKRLQNRMAKDSINDGNKSKINIIAFDACLMGNIEAINHFKDLSEIIVTSEDVFPGSGYPYDKILQKLKADPNIDPNVMAINIINQTKDYYKNKFGNIVITQAALDCHELKGLNQMIYNLANKMTKYLGNDKEAANVIKSCIENAFNFGEGYRDLKNIAESLLDCQIPYNLSVAARSLKDFFEQSGLILASDVPGGKGMPAGISIYCPDPAEFDPQYLRAVNSSDMGFWPWFLGMYALCTLGQDAVNSPLIGLIDETMKDLMGKGEYRPNN